VENPLKTPHQWDFLHHETAENIDLVLCVENAIDQAVSTKLCCKLKTNLKLINLLFEYK
jgi:hypothetical protein